MSRGALACTSGASEWGGTLGTPETRLRSCIYDIYEYRLEVPRGARHSAPRPGLLPRGARGRAKFALPFSWGVSCETKR